MPFKPGESGNPGGRKRSVVNWQAMLDRLNAADESGSPGRLEKVFLKLQELAEAGDVKAAALYLSYSCGKPREVPADAEGQPTLRVVVDMQPRLEAAKGGANGGG